MYGSHRRSCEFIADVAPARCADMLRQKQVDAALIPSIEYQRLDDVLIVPGLAVAADGPVRSVILVHQKPLEEVNSVSLDLSSRTGAALTMIYFRHFQRREVRFEPHPPHLVEMLRKADAALLIGDPALLAYHHSVHLPSPTSPQITDWGELWKQLTGLPFVFAVWAIRRESVDRMAGIDFSLVKKEAGSSLPHIIDEAVNRLQLPYELVHDYLTRSLVYDLNHGCLSGLNHFYTLAWRVNLIDVLNPIRFYEVTVDV